MRSESEVMYAMDKYADMIKRICICHLKNREDTEDVFQNIFLKYMLYQGSFDTIEYEKAWFIRVAVNACKDHLLILLRHRTESIELMQEEPVWEPKQGYVLEALLTLPDKYKDVLYLHYYEGYSAVEIAELLHKRQNTIYSILSRGRQLLKEKLGGEEIAN